MALPDLLKRYLQRKIVAGNGLSGGGTLSGDVTLNAKLTDSVSSTDSTTAASAAAVKMAYDRGTAGINAASSAQNAADAKLPLSGGTMTGPIKDVGGTYTPTPTERYAKSAIVIREADYVGNTRSDIGYAPALAFFWLNRTAGTLALDHGGIFRFLDYYGNRAYVDCQVPIADLATTATYADNAGLLNGKAENALSVAHASSANAANAAGIADTFKNGAGTPTSWLIEYPNEAPTYLWGTHDGVTMRLWNPTYFSVNYASSAGNAGTLGGKAESTLSVSYAANAGYANTAQNAYGLTGMDSIISDTRAYTLPGYGTWRYFYIVVIPGALVDIVIGEAAGGTVLTTAESRPGAMMRGMAFRSA